MGLLWHSPVCVPCRYGWHVSMQEDLYRGMCTKASVSDTYMHAWVSYIFPIGLTSVATVRWAVTTEVNNYLLDMAFFHFSE